MGGVLLGAGIVLLILRADEASVLDTVVSQSVQPVWADEQKVIALTSVAHRLLSPRTQFFGRSLKASFRRTWLRSADSDLVRGGACGTYAGLLGRLLDAADIDFRVVQLYCEDVDVWGCHIVLEVEVDGTWRSVDPLFNVVFPVSAEALRDDWIRYRNIVPPEYNPMYDYSNFRYTNWDKIPVLMPALRRMLELVSPDTAKTLSVRRHVLDVYSIWSASLIGLASLSFVVAWWILPPLGRRLSLMRSLD